MPRFLRLRRWISTAPLLVNERFRQPECVLPRPDEADYPHRTRFLDTMPAVNRGRLGLEPLSYAQASAMLADTTLTAAPARSLAHSNLL
jgi:hypothetical protein